MKSHIRKKTNKYLFLLLIPSLLKSVLECGHSEAGTPSNHSEGHFKAGLWRSTSVSYTTETHASRETQPLVGWGPAVLLLASTRDISSAHGSLAFLPGAQTYLSSKQRDRNLGLALAWKTLASEAARHRFRSTSASSSSKSSLWANSFSLSSSFLFMFLHLWKEATRTYCVGLLWGLETVPRKLSSLQTIIPIPRIAIHMYYVYC